MLPDRAFAVSAPEDVLSSFAAQDINGHKPNVDEDQVVRNHLTARHIAILIKCMQISIN